MITDIILRDYQQILHDKIIDSLKVNKKVLAYLPTGGGKSVLIGSLANNLKGRTLILTHRIEVLTQNSKWIKNCGTLIKDINTVKDENNVVIAMAQTLHSRIKKHGIDYIGKFDNIIIDECHVLIFDKIFKQYKYNKLIGFTGSPVLNKILKKNIGGEKYIKNMTLGDMFDDIVYYFDTQNLIDNGYLVQDYNITLQPDNIDKLVETKQTPDGYTIQSLNTVYSNTTSLKLVVDTVNKYFKDKKVIIYNASVLVNEALEKELLKNCDNDIFLFDSINKRINGKDYNIDREYFVKTYKAVEKGVLVNANVFTTGFDVDDIDGIIVNRATKSLALWIQMVGRGSRITNKKLKDKFVVIDLGNNIYNHGKWSNNRNWKNIFKPQQWRPARTYDMLSTWDCPKCGAILTKNETKCKYCGYDKLKDVKERKIKERKGKLVEVSKPKLPSGNKIIEYTKSINENAAFAYNLAEKKIIELYIITNVTKSQYFSKRLEFMERTRAIYLPIYFAIINSDLNGANRRLNTMLKRLYLKVDNMYK